MSNVLFEIDHNKIADMSLLDASRPGTLEAFDQEKLSSEERLFFRLWGSSLLSTGVFDIGKKLMTRGQTIDFAHVIISGQVEVTTPEDVFTLGRGSVLGLAEGLAGVPAVWDVKALTFINTRIIPIDRALKQVQSSNAGLKGICRITVKRILGMNHAPEGF